MKLENHERKTVLQLLTSETVEPGIKNITVWPMMVLGVLSIANHSIGNPNAIDELFDGIGLTFVFLALADWVNLRRMGLIQKMARRLDVLDPGWTLSDE